MAVVVAACAAGLLAVAGIVVLAARVSSAMQKRQLVFCWLLAYLMLCVFTSLLGDLSALVIALSAILVPVAVVGCVVGWALMRSLDE